MHHISSLVNFIFAFVGPIAGDGWDAAAAPPVPGAVGLDVPAPTGWE